MPAVACYVSEKCRRVNCVLQKMSDWLETLLEVFMSHVTRVRVLEEVTAAIAVLVDEGTVITLSLI